MACPRRGLPPERPILLGSVASAEEAALALRLPVAIVDLKDPHEGVLAACRPELWRAAAALRDRVAPRALMSAALGEIRVPRDATLAASRAALARRLGFDFVKVGLAGDADDAVAALGAVVAAGRGTAGEGPRPRVIAVACVDAATSGALRPMDLPRVASFAGADGCLLDTALKDGRSLTDHVSLRETARFVGACHSLGLLAALAGSLDAGHLPRLVPLRPDVIGARGALCRESRAGRLERGRVHLFHDALRAARKSIAAAAARPGRQAAATVRRPASR
jgi:uncharacterized protein (UPF0264 family)